jgi:hypothetical protein
MSHEIIAVRLQVLITKFYMKRIINIIVLMVVLFSCKSVYSQLSIDLSPNTERFKLYVGEYLNSDGLFTLILEDEIDEELGKTDVFLLYQNRQGKTYTHYLYSVYLSFEQRLENSNRYCIDDNSVYLNDKGRYTIYNQGKGSGYSDAEEVEFIPPKIREGSYNFQIVLYFENYNTYAYSNIIKLDIPLKSIN